MRFDWKTSGGEQRTACAWRRPGGAGVLVCIHGLSGSGDQFEPVADHLGHLSVYAIELRGQAFDPVEARRSVVLDVPAQHGDITDFLEAVRSVHPGEPVFLVGESMGSLLVASYLAGYPGAPVSGAVLSVPVVSLIRPVPPWVRTAARWLGRLFPRLKLPPSWFVSRGAEAPCLTRDRAYQDSLFKRPYHISVYTLSFLSELGDLIERSAEVAGRLSKPVLVLSAGNDCFVPPDSIREWFGLVASADKTLREYPGAYHLLWHDDDRQRVLGDLGSWLEARRDQVARSFH